MPNSEYYGRTAGHGTAARARRHYRDGETPCEPCRLAANEDRKANARANGGWRKKGRRDAA